MHPSAAASAPRRRAACARPPRPRRRPRPDPYSPRQGACHRPLRCCRVACAAGARTRRRRRRWPRLAGARVPPRSRRARRSRPLLRSSDAGAWHRRRARRAALRRWAAARARAEAIDVVVSAALVNTRRRAVATAFVRWAPTPPPRYLRRGDGRLSSYRGTPATSAARHPPPRAKAAVAKVDTNRRSLLPPPPQRAASSITTLRLHPPPPPPRAATLASAVAIDGTSRRLREVARAHPQPAGPSGCTALAASCCRRSRWPTVRDAGGVPQLERRPSSSGAQTRTLISPFKAVSRPSSARTASPSSSDPSSKG